MSTGKKYQDCIIRFQNVESEIKNTMQTKIVRSAEIVLSRKLEEGERNEVINNPKVVQQLYEKKLTGTAHVKLQNAVADLEERHQDLLKLENVF